ncbi:F-box/LRR-repeat protein 3 isoform X2 [Punica granatum]|uniref:F-box/LRR-repeat protein 15-like leucin rich repeat domain-containing protein n=2 Tax=Punica granatum TaxID=22663 RepID=A0A218W3H1_PUNGR|nr:F-box/LRR-repeat protein 3 isoform X2 [Punica granatum]OWM67079.1 hypothetical protein CDL15_Pgr000531 [Punica granatum]PKI51423.1 hypothetical protein CRG98_028134 [Punica granatum]
MKKQKTAHRGQELGQELKLNPFDFLSEEIVFTILDLLGDNPLDKKSFSLVCKSFYSIESSHRRALRPLRPDHLPKILARYPNTARLDLTLCPRVTDASLAVVSSSCGPCLRSIDLSRSRFFSATGLSQLAARCGNLVEVDLSNARELRDPGAAALSGLRNLERLWLGRCKLITDMGVGCIAVGCRKLKLLSLKWCLGVGDLGVGLVAVKCREIRNLDLSYLPISNKCLPSIMKLPYLEDLILEGCFGIDDNSLAAVKQGCKSLKALDISSCQNISHVGLSSIASSTEGLQQLTLAYGSPVTAPLAASLKKLIMLQSIKLDGCSVTCSGLKAIGSCFVSLRELSLSKCSGVTDEGFSFLVTRQKQLKKLDITCCRQITDVSIAHVTSSCTGLTSLRMESCCLVSKEAFVLIGQRCHSLEELDLTDNEVDDEGLKSIGRCSRLTVLKLGICLNITDEGLTHIGRSCSKLVELDLYRSAGISGSGIQPIACGCPNLELINTSYCYAINDAALRSLSKCMRLNTLECRGCPLITSLGLAAIAIGCKQLAKLDIKKCHLIDDAGMIPLAHFSQNLRQINLSYTSVTDLGLSSLASISCLQSMTILHLKGLTPWGLAAALLACGGLTKVKLHATFKMPLPQSLFEHLETRGCVFHWRDKAFQAELDPKSWRLKLEDIVP